ncbi:hypothetical protein [Cedecea neteri]|uniref:hypothetical protein n=1 Tax=Cedecea neteri TaxID=158822 RepID=UPI00289B855B|nr:hypothetical protein [Cedecea neteri]
MTMSDNIALWSMIGTWVAAISALITALITAAALYFAYKTLHSWKDKEKIMQMVRVKRAIFSYRQRVESIRFFNGDDQKIKEHLQNALQPSLSDIFNEMKLAGMEEGKCPEFELLDALVETQGMYERGQVGWSELFDRVVKLQRAIKVSL